MINYDIASYREILPQRVQDYLDTTPIDLRTADSLEMALIAVSERIRQLVGRRAIDEALRLQDASIIIEDMYDTRSGADAAYGQAAA